MVGGCREIFYKGIGEEFGLTKSWWKIYEVQVGSLLKEFSKIYLW
jgi:hypothetical protein